MMTPAWSTTVGTPESRKIWPTSAREARWVETDSSSPGTRPPRYTIRSVPAASATATTLFAASRSVSSKCPPVPMEWTR